MKEWDRKYNLVRELTAKDLKIRYSRPILGFLWAFLSPFLTVIIFYIIFGLMLKVETKEAPFVLYLMSGVFPWIFFQDSLLKSITSLVDNKNLIKESNFPAYLIPVSIVMANTINFLPSLLILALTSLFILKTLPVFIMLLPFVLLIHLLILIGLSITVSILYVKYRDIKYVVEAILLLLFYLTPVFYSFYLVKESFLPLFYKIYIHNPFFGISNLYRCAILKGFCGVVQKELGFLNIVIMPIIFSIIILSFSLYFYKKTKDTINDHLAY